MENGKYVTIPLERYEQLIRAEHDANQLKSLIEDKHTLDYGDMRLLQDIYIGNKEEIEE